MSSAAELVLAVVLMPAAGYALIGARWAAHRLDEARSKPPPPVPVERLAVDLRRLRADLETTETRVGLIAKHHRVQAALRQRGLHVRETAAR